MIAHIIEDDPGVNDSLGCLLRSMGHEVRSHNTAEGFFRFGPPGPNDLVIIDLMLPGTSGAQAIRWLRWGKVPPRIVAISGQSDNVIASQLKGLPILQVMRKPLTFEVIAELVRNLTASRFEPRAALAAC